ncbi:hypothetical protein, partial [Endozoicomonas sp. YOMI1]|uniref:hypothetical protein n=1 Tax=Endozoicomonas sp. YOMI1 TaxID=2828739 RepID=UPI002147D95A
LEQINPATGGNLLHILFKSSFINHKDIKLNDLINIVDWLDKTYGLTPFLQGCLENDGSTPLHLLLSTVNTKLRSDCLDSLTLQEHILKQLCQPNADGLLLVELLKLKDNNGCTPLHKFFSCKNINKKIDDLLIHKLGHETFCELMLIKDKQGNTVMDHCSKLHKGLHEKYKSMFQTHPTAVEVQEPGSEASERI